MYFLGRKCIFCDKYGLYKLKNKKVKCKNCKKYYSLRKLKREMEILYYFYLEVSARKTAKELNFNYRLVHRKFMQFRKKIADYCNQEAKKLNGELELDESYFGGKRKGNRGRGAKSETQGVYIFKSLTEAKSSGQKNYIIFGQDFDARLGDTSKSGSVEVLFNRENPYVPVGENTHFSILAGKRANEISSEIKIRSFNPASNELAVVDNKGFTILNDNTKSDFIFGAIGEEKGKAVSLSVGNYLNKEQVPMLARNHLDKKFDEKEIQIASLYSDIAEKVYFTSNINAAEGLVVDSNLLSYRNNFKPTIAKEIPFMQDVFEKNVVVTMDTVDFIESDVGKDYLSYKPGHQTLKDIQNKNYGAYKKALIDKVQADSGRPLTETEANNLLKDIEKTINSNKDPATKTNELNKLAIDNKMTQLPDISVSLTPGQEQRIIDTVSFCSKYGKQLKGQGISGCSLDEFLGQNEIQIINQIASSQGISQENAVRQYFQDRGIRFGPRFLFLNPKIPAQNWWSLTY